MGINSLLVRGKYFGICNNILPVAGLIYQLLTPLDKITTGIEIEFFISFNRLPQIKGV